VSSANGGMMRHDIPHRWQKTLRFIDWCDKVSIFCSVAGFTCPGCALPSGLVRFALKCRECGMMAHTRCETLCYNTCGMSMQMYNIYVTQRDPAALSVGRRGPN